ncbi:MAG TPA: hypothetical protein VJ779_08515 [Acetobacteraceae bacterium]|nr:hypothetical protein [Acetobacteraceae bacterium]
MIWLTALRRYLAATAVLDLVWETLQLPLYTIWRDGMVRAKAFAILHCTAGDLRIALALLVGALVAVGDPAWPGRRFGGVAILTILGGLAYTVFSEWLNVEVRRSWAYSPLMPVLPSFGTGLSPVLQWLTIPTLALWAAHRADSEPRT